MHANPTTLQAAARALLLGLGLILAGGAGAADEAGGQSAAQAVAPPLPPRVQHREEYGQTITEYSRGGRVFLMTVKPRVGPTQYWEDPDGDGQFQQSTSDDIEERLNLPKWKLGDW